MDFWSNLLMQVTKQPRRLAGTLGVGDTESYLTQLEQQKAQQAQDTLINLITGVTKPFAKGANILAKGYGDLYRGMSGNTDYVSGAEKYIRSGITDEEHQRIEDNPYKEILKSGAGMASTLAPFSTAGTFTNAATRGTRAFDRMNLMPQNPFVNRTSQLMARGTLEGGLGGFGYSRPGYEAQDTLAGVALGNLGEVGSELLFNPSYRQMFKESGNPGGYLQMGAGDIDADSYEGLRRALDRGEIKPDEFIEYTGDPEGLFTNVNVSNPVIENMDDLPDIPVYEDGDQAYSDLLKSDGDPYEQVGDLYKDMGILPEGGVAQGGEVPIDEKTFLQAQEEAERLKNVFRDSNNREDYMAWRKAQNRTKGLQEELLKKEAATKLASQRKSDTNLRKANPNIDSLDSTDEKFLLSEAKKHESSDEFIRKMRGSATQYGEYSPKLRKYVKPESIVVGEIPGANPDTVITVYRGIDMDNVGGKKINVGDFVTTDYQDALGYTNSPAKVVSKRVKLKDLVAEYPEEVYFDDPSGPASYELIYNPGGKIKKITDTKLEDIWRRAQGK